MAKNDALEEVFEGFSLLEIDEAKQRHNVFKQVLEQKRAELQDSDSSEASTVYKYRRSRRKKKRVNYMEVEEPLMDRLFWCDPCEKSFTKACSVHGPLLVIPNDQDKKEGMCASLSSIPKNWIAVGPSSIPGGGLGVFAIQGLPPRVQLGPYEGVLTNKPDPTSNYIWQIEVGENGKKMYVDGKDRDNSSWLRFVNCSRHVSEQNLQAFQHRGKMYYRTVSLIWPGSELLVYYGPQFAKTLGVQSKDYFAPIKAPLEISPHALMKPQKPEMPSLQNVRRKNSKKNEVPVEDDSTKPYKCDTCGKGFTQSGSLTMHIRTHSGERPFKCDVCGKGFADRGNLTKHTRTHTGDRPYKCDICGKGFTDSSYLTTHKRVHSGDRPYKCDTCGKGFTQSCNLTKHMRVHSGEKPYKCHICGKEFADSSSLTKHKRVHSGEKPYKCHICEKEFAHSNALTFHIRVHTGDRPYKCDTCGKGFTNSSHLTKHKRVHSGEKPYKCDTCGKGFTQNGHLTTHKKTHIGEKQCK